MPKIKIREETYCTENAINAGIPTMNLIRIPPDASMTHLVMSLLICLIVSFLIALRVRLPPKIRIMKAQEKQLETLIDLSKNAII